MWTGSKIEISELQKAMNQAKKYCIAEGKRLNFPAFVSAADPDERTGRLLARNILTDVFGILQKFVFSTL